MTNCDHHEQAETSSTQRLLWALVVIVVFMVVEFIGGILSGSLALLADATHMLTDAFALTLAVSAQLFAARPADSKLHFGYRRAQVLAAFVNGVLMAVLLLWIVYEAVLRLFNPVEIQTSLMFWVAVAGLIANAIAFAIVHRRHEHNVNMRGAVLHIVGDFLGSAAAVIGALVIGATGWTQVDPILSLIVAVLIGISAFRLLKETGFILLEGAPEDIDITELANGLKQSSPLIRDVHKVQIWQITRDNPRLTLHACVENAGDAGAALAAAKEYLEQKYKIRQSTIQVEVGSDCPDMAASASRVEKGEPGQAEAGERAHQTTSGATNTPTLAT